MNPTARIHNIAQLPRPKPETRLLERRLHLLPAKEPQIPSPLHAAAIALRLGQLLERRAQFLVIPPRFVQYGYQFAQVGNGLLLGVGDFGIAPGGGLARSAVFFEYVQDSHFFGFSRSAAAAAAVVMSFSFVMVPVPVVLVHATITVLVLLVLIPAKVSAIGSSPSLILWILRFLSFYILAKSSSDMHPCLIGRQTDRRNKSREPFFVNEKRVQLSATRYPGGV